MRTHVDLFSGVSGFGMAAEWAGIETIAFAEIDTYASKVLEQCWPLVRNYGDVRNIPELSAWLLTGGPPCQPASLAGKREGATDDRWLWPEALAVVERGDYEWVMLEQPGGILTLDNGVAFEQICLGLESLGYAVQPFDIPACAVGADHRRQRLWILAHANRDGVERRSYGETPAEDGSGRSGRPQNLFAQREFAAGYESGRESELLRADARLSDWAHRVRCVGNNICPQVAFQIIKRMIEVEQ